MADIIEHEGIARVGEIYHVDIDKVAIVQGHNPRTNFGDEEDGTLMQDILKQGILTPIMLHLEDGKLNLIDGERRLRAAYEARKIKPEIGIVPAQIKTGPLTELEKMQLAFSANKHKKLKPSEVGKNIQKFLNLGMNQTEMAEFLGKSGAWVSKMKRASACIADVLNAMDDGKITLDQMCAISKFGGEEQVGKLKEYVAERAERREAQYSSRSETMAEKRTGKGGKTDKPIDLPTVTDSMRDDELGMDDLDRRIKASFGDQAESLVGKVGEPVQTTLPIENKPTESHEDAPGATKTTKATLRLKMTPDDVAQSREQAIQDYMSAEDDYNRGLNAGLIQAFSAMLGLDDNLELVMTEKTAA